MITTKIFKNIIKHSDKVIQRVTMSLMVVVESIGKTPQDDAGVIGLAPMKVGG